MDRWTHSFLTNLFHWATVSINFFCDLYDSLTHWIKQIRLALAQAQARDKWILLNQNSLPYCVKEDYDTSSYGLRTRIFYPDSRTFLLHSLEGTERNRFDIVDAVLEKEGEDSVNITEFMMSILWTSPMASPSLFEVVLLSNLLTQTSEPVSKMDRWKLVIMDSDANTHTINLDSGRAKQRFVAWE